MTKRKKNGSTEVVTEKYSLQADSSVRMLHFDGPLSVPPSELDVEALAQRYVEALAKEFSVPAEVWGVDLAAPGSQSETVIVGGDLVDTPKGTEVKNITVNMKIDPAITEKFKKVAANLDEIVKRNQEQREKGEEWKRHAAGGPSPKWSVYEGIQGYTSYKIPRHPAILDPNAERQWAANTRARMSFMSAQALNRLKQVKSPVHRLVKQEMRQLAIDICRELKIVSPHAISYDSPLALMRAANDAPTGKQFIDWRRILECETRPVFSHLSQPIGRSAQGVVNGIVRGTSMEYPYAFSAISTNHPSAPDNPLSRYFSTSPNHVLLFPALENDLFFATAEAALPAYPNVVRMLLEMSEFVTCVAIVDNEFMIAWRPAEAHLDDRDRLHNPDGPAMVWADGFSLYAYKGVSMPKEAFMPGSRTARYANSFMNTEQRRAMIEMMGQDEYIKQVGFVVIDDDPKYGRLLVEGTTVEIASDRVTWRPSITAFDRYGNPIENPLVVLEVTNRTPEPDGTYKQYWMEVPPTCRTAHEANAATWGLTPATYKPEFET